MNETSTTAASRDRMAGKVALVTGAARGMGRSHALALAREGADIVALDAPGSVQGAPYELGSADDLEETAAAIEALGRRVVAVAGDVRSQADLDGAVARGIEELGGIDVCVANAGVTSVAPFWELSEDEWDAVVEVGLGGTWRTAKAVAPHMIEREEGAMVLVSSVCGLEGTPGLAHYSAAKHGVLGLMKSICIELGPTYGIRCNAVLPGVVDTDMIKWDGVLDFMAGGEGQGSLANLERGARVWGALKDVGAIPAEAVSDAVLYLASAESRHVTGLGMTIDAGHGVLPGLNAVAMGEQGGDEQIARPGRRAAG